MDSKSIPTVPAKNIVFKTKSPDAWFGIDYNMNIYRGCSHGCIYCDSRSDCFKNTDFDTVKAKENALQIVRDDLRRRVVTGVVGNGAMSDPYNPREKELNLTRNSLELINAFRFGVSLCTKSDLVARDADILLDIKAHSPTIVKFSISTADDELCKKLEPFVSVTSERFEAMRRLSSKGIFCGVQMIPLLPYINDSEENIVRILNMAKEAGAKFVHTYMGMTLRAGSREYYYKHLDNILPGVKEKYIKRFGFRYSCISPRSKKLWDVFTAECARLDLLFDMRNIIRHYKYGYEKQLLFNFNH
ncbi:MAG: radical SAM protein [Treponema sp.]|nr:radical SAM protein [Treponema sp.]